MLGGVDADECDIIGKDVIRILHREPAKVWGEIIDKYRYHLPEYRQVKQYADLGVRLPASPLNDWVHAVAARLEPLYEALVMTSSQAIISRLTKCRGA